MLYILTAVPHKNTRYHRHFNGECRGDAG